MNPEAKNGQNELDIPDQWTTCRIHNYPGGGIAIFFMFFKAGHCVGYHEEDGNDGSKVAVIKPATHQKFYHRDLYYEIFGRIKSENPQVEILFY